jgi:hypothetical protein
MRSSINVASGAEQHTPSQRYSSGLCLRKSGHIAVQCQVQSAVFPINKHPLSQVCPICLQEYNQRIAVVELGPRAHAREWARDPGDCIHSGSSGSFTVQVQ